MSLPTKYRRSFAVTLSSMTVVATAALILTSRQPTAHKPLYTTAAVARGDILRGVNAVGQLSPLVMVDVSSQISGLVTEVHVDFNSAVRRGQLLARIDPSTYEQRLRQAQASLAAARSNRALALIESNRLRDLHEQGIVSSQELDQVEARLQESTANLLTNQAAVENARVDVARCSITSPIDGVVIFKQIEIGKTVISSFNAPTLFTIAPDLAKMKIVAKVSEVDISGVRIGQDVHFTVDAVPGRTFFGKLSQVRNPYTPSDGPKQAPETAIAMFDTVVELSNPNLILRPGSTANISIVIERRTSVLKIPNGALRLLIVDAATTPVESDDNSGIATVYRIPRGDRSAGPERVQVRLGVSDSMVTEVIAGLNEGDTIVTSVILSSKASARWRFLHF
jgi:HlyD family secretion protein